MISDSAKSTSAVERVVEALHVLLLELRLTRLGHWSRKLEDIHFLDLHILSQAEHRADHTIGELRAVLDVPQSTLTSMIDRLERKGLIRRAICARDKRSYRIELTAAGREVQREHRRVERLIGRRMLDGLPDEKARAQFVGLLATMTRRPRAE